MRDDRHGTSKGQAGSTRLLSTEELFEGFNEIYESAESEGETAGPSTTGVSESASDGGPGAQAGRLEITESGDAFNVRAELPSLDFLKPPAPDLIPELGAPSPAKRAARRTRRLFNPVLRAIDLLADADRENITATLKGGMLEVKLPKGRVESLAAARSALLSPAASGRPRSA
jgi:hypothetical protein